MTRTGYQKKESDYRLLIEEQHKFVELNQHNSITSSVARQLLCAIVSALDLLHPITAPSTPVNMMFASSILTYHKYRPSAEKIYQNPQSVLSGRTGRKDNMIPMQMCHTLAPLDVDQENRQDLKHANKKKLS